MAPDRASDATMVRSEWGPSVSEPGHFSSATEPRNEESGVWEGPEGAILMENILKLFSWMEIRLGWVWCPHCLQKDPPSCGLLLNYYLLLKSCQQSSQPLWDLFTAGFLFPPEALSFLELSGS